MAELHRRDGENNRSEDNRSETTAHTARPPPTAAHHAAPAALCRRTIRHSQVGDPQAHFDHVRLVFEAAAKGDQDVTQGAGKHTAISATPATALPGSVAGGASGAYTGPR